jgi:hypothetical protein
MSLENCPNRTMEKGNYYGSNGEYGPERYSQVAEPKPSLEILPSSYQQFWQNLAFRISQDGFPFFLFSIGRARAVVLRGITITSYGCGVQVTCLFTSQFLRLRRTSYQLQHHEICIN